MIPKLITYYWRIFQTTGSIFVGRIINGEGFDSKVADFRTGKVRRASSMNEQVPFTPPTDSLGKLITDAAEVLSDSGVPEARREAGSLLAYVLAKDRTYLISHADEIIDYKQVNAFKGLVLRRAAGEPLQYITGVQDFFGLQFKVTSDVLIPRPETELLVEVALGLLKQTPIAMPRICDVGTGSGCIAISLLHCLPAASAVALDISPAALEIATTNSLQHRVLDRISLVVSDCFNGLNDDVSEFDLIVSNPPYVSANALAGLQREVRDHEPRIALSPGGDGLMVIKRLLAESPYHLKPLGHLVIEIGFDQGEAVRKLINPNIWQLLDIHPDLQRIPRIVALQRKGT